MSALELSEFKNALRRKSVEEINAEYRVGDITAGDKHYMLREKARVSLEDTLENRGFLGAVWQKSIDNFMEGWDNFKESAENSEGGAPTSFYYTAQGMWSIVQMLTSGFSAIGEVTGSKVESLALQYGASPGAARVLGIAADVATGFIPIGGAARLGAKAVQGVKAAATGAKEAAAAAKAAEAAVNEARVLKIVADGLEVDGIKGASKLIEAGAKEAAPDVAEAMVRSRTTLKKLEASTVPESAVQQAMQGPTKLPRELAGAKPRYNYGSKEFFPQFESDIDKALYIVAQNNPSKRDKQYIEWLRTVFPGQSDADIRAMGRVVRNEIKTMAKDAPSGIPLAIKATGRTGRAETFVEEASRLAKNISLEDARKALPSLMKKFGLTMPDMKTINKTGAPAYSAQEFYGHLKALEGRSQDLMHLAKHATAAGATDIDRIAFAQYATKLFTGLEDRVKYSKEFTNMLIHWDPEAVASGNLMKAMQTFAEDMASLDKRSTQKLLGQSQSLFAFGVNDQNWPMIKEFFKNSLLPVSWSASILGNSYAAGRMIVERAAGAPSAQTAALQAFYTAKGMTLAVGDAIRAVGKVYADSPSRNVTPGWFGRVSSGFGRDAAMAVDTFYKEIFKRAHLYAEGFREAERAGAANVGSFVKSYAMSPTAPALERASSLAAKATFSNDLGEFGKLFTKMAQSGPGDLYFAFMKSPINLVKYSWDRTPGLQLLSKQLYDDILAGGIRAEEAVGRLTLANLEAMFWYEMAKEGFVTGNGPADPALRASYVATRPVTSIKTPVGYLSMDKMQPALAPISFMADLADIRDHLDDMKASQAMMAGVLGFVKSYANQTAWRTASEVVDTINGIARGEKLTKHDKTVVLSPMMSLVSGGPLVSRIESINDPVLRDARNLMDAWKARVPGYSAEVPPLRDGYGEPIIPPQNIGPSWFGLFSPLAPRMQAFEDNPVKQEGAALRARLPRFPDQIGLGQLPDDWDITAAQPGDPLPVAITPKQRDRWQQIYNNLIRGKGTEDNPGIETGLLSTEVYKRAPRALQRQMFQDYLQDMKSSARDMLMVEDKELGKRALENSYRNVMPMVDKTERPAVTEEMTQDLRLFDQMADEEKRNLLRWGYLEPDQPKETKPVEVYGFEIMGSRSYRPLTERPAELGAEK